MPIRFRCPGCDGLLSISRRKAGTDISCPKCAELVIVPPLPNDMTEPELRALPDDEGEGDGTPTLQPEPPRSKPEPPKTKPEPKPESKSRPKPTESGRVATAPRPEPEKPRAAVAEADPKPKSKPGKDDAPLFERSDFEALLNPAVAKASVDPKPAAAGAKPLPLPDDKPAAKPVPLPIPPAGTALATGPNAEGIFLSRGALTMMVVLGLVLLALSFAAGFLVGS